MPCREWFAAQDQSYRDEVLPPALQARVSVEAAHHVGWHEVVGDAGRVIGIDHYGASADYQTLFREFGLHRPRRSWQRPRESIQASRRQLT